MQGCWGDKIRQNRGTRIDHPLWKSALKSGKRNWYLSKDKYSSQQTEPDPEDKCRYRHRPPARCHERFWPLAYRLLLGSTAGPVSICPAMRKLSGSQPLSEGLTSGLKSSTSSLSLQLWSRTRDSIRDHFLPSGAMQQRSLITGAAGFIGAALAARLSEDPDHALILVDSIEPAGARRELSPTGAAAER